MSSEDTHSLTEHEVVESLERLGLSNYAAQVFVALQLFGPGTTKQLTEETAVPRSQVYGAAEELINRGLVELQQSTPKKYRAVDLSAARQQLLDALESEADRAFSFLETNQHNRSAENTDEDVWLIRGRVPIQNRVVELLEGAEESIVCAFFDPTALSEPIVSQLEQQSNTETAVRVLCPNESVATVLRELDALVVDPSIDAAIFDGVGCVVLVDNQAFLVSTTTAETTTPDTALWSAETVIARLFVAVLSEILP
ncbi:TrmB family transcriptional regulator [Halobellus rufus]|uniref:TrmB family transcriptional regulator n=1 Tax=Halobellus rufus TaxID=1448860 RepID=UPI000678AFEE|nr:helix-turn-helix domain-containing protein [Halobellus rufus]